MRYLSIQYHSNHSQNPSKNINMQSIFPSIEIGLPSKWNLSFSNGIIPCDKPHLWVHCKEPLPTDTQPTADIALSQLVGISLRFQGDNRLWTMIKTELLLGYDPQRAGNIFGGSFDESRLFHFEAALRSEQLTLLSLMDYTVSQFTKQFVSGGLSQELKSDTSYRLTTVTQSFPKNPNVQIGMSMDWT